VTYEYPADEDLEKVETWNGNWRECFAFIRSIWWMPEWGWHESTEKDEFTDKLVTRYSISTGGWSGNESIIEAMEANRWMRWYFWQQSRRGGHYIYEVPDELATMAPQESK
jgi:hypothetical protein